MWKRFHETFSIARQIRYDSGYLTCSKKLTGSQLSLPHGINRKLKCETKNKMVSMIGPVQRCYRGQSSWGDRDELRSGWGGESRQEWWGWRNESGSWFQRLFGLRGSVIMVLTLQTPKAIIVPHRIIRSWYTGRWWVCCYIWYSKEGPGRAAVPPSPLLAVSNVTAHPSMASVPITVLLYDVPLLCVFNMTIKGLNFGPSQSTSLRQKCCKLPSTKATWQIFRVSFCLRSWWCCIYLDKLFLLHSLLHLLKWYYLVCQKIYIMKLMLHNYDSQKRSVLFWPHKRNNDVFINSSLQWWHLPGKIITWSLVMSPVTRLPWHFNCSVYI